MLAYKEFYTYEDYKNWGGDWELVDGVAFAMAPFAIPSHQKVAVKIVRQLDESLENCKNCHALMESEVKFREDTVVRPDVFMKCGEIDDISILPEIIFEIVSKGSIKRDEILKFELYRREGVKYYGIVYPDEKKVRVYKLKNGEYIKVFDIKDEVLEINDLSCKIKIDFSKVWL